MGTAARDPRRTSAQAALDEEAPLRACLLQYSTRPELANRLTDVNRPEDLEVVRSFLQGAA